MTEEVKKLLEKLGFADETLGGLIWEVYHLRRERDTLIDENEELREQIREMKESKDA